MRTLGNILWLIFGGPKMAGAHVIAGVLLCLTFVGIPLGVASFKLVGLALLPLGARIVPSDSLGAQAAHYQVGEVG